MLLRIGGGIAMIRGAATVVVPVAASSTESGGPVPASGGAGTATVVLPEASEDYRLDWSRSTVALGGVAAVAVSYLFDGHTVTASPGWIVRAADLAHVVGAGIWVGGVLMLGWTLGSRWKRGAPLRAAELAVRFSRVASVALGVVAAAGLALTWAILDTPGELVSTPWGRLLLAKLAVVGIAAGLGAVNHFRVVPALEADRGNGAAADLLRRVVRAEGAVLLVVIAVTAVLVGAAS